MEQVQRRPALFECVERAGCQRAVDEDEWLVRRLCSDGGNRFEQRVKSRQIVWFAVVK